MRIGIFGGSFNPPHMGHINSASTVQKKLGLDRVLIIPSNRSPLKVPVDGPSAEQRLEMTRLAFSTFGDKLVVDDRELKRGGISYTIDTIHEIEKENPGAKLFLIIGPDQFFDFSQWKDFAKIFEKADIIVTSRPGYDLPATQEELPAYIQPFVEEYEFNFIELKTGHSVQFLSLNDVVVSSTELRKTLRIGRPVEKHIPLALENYIKAQRLYRPLGDKIGNYAKFTEFCANALFAKKGINVRGFDLTQSSAPSEYTLVASGTSTRHAVAMAENLVLAVKEEFNVHPQSVEGTDEGRWVVVDYGNLIVHVFYDFVRQEYSLESLWQGSKDMKLKDPDERSNQN